MKIKAFFPYISLINIAIVLTIGACQNITNAPIVEKQAVSVNLTVSAAISLTGALQDIKSLYLQSHKNITITYNFGASGSLEQQIEQGAPVDVFISAAAKQMDTLQQKKLLISETRKNLLTNRLVLITPKNALSLSNFTELARPQVQRIAIGEPKSVPAGEYAQEFLRNIKILDQVKPKLIYGNNVRQVLTYVETGNVNAGIVYATDAKQSNRVQVAATAAENLHSPIVYPVAVIKRSQNAAAAIDFVQFLSSNTAKAVFKKYGFRIAS